MSQSLQDQDPWTIPLAPPPSGIVSSFHKQSSLMGLSVGITVVVFALMVATLSLRFWTKYKGQEKWHLDDSFAILTFVLTIVVATLQFYVTEYLGFPAWNIPMGLMMKSWIHNILRAVVCTTLVMLFLGKCAILAFYLRIFGHVAYVRYQIYSAFVLAFAIIVTSILMPVWVEAVWRLGAASPAFHTANMKITITANLTIAIGIIKLVLNLVIVYIPIPVVMGMKLSRAKKVGVLATFLTGSIAIVADIIDVYFRVKVYKGQGTFINGIYICLCGLVEAGISVIVASMPAAAKAWKRHVMTSSLYKMITARPSRSNVPTTQQLPSDFRVAKAEAQKKKRRWGLYSIPSLVMSNRSAARPGPTNRAKDGAMPRSEMTLVRNFRQSLEEKFASLDSSSLELRDPADLGASGSIV